MAPRNVRDLAWQALKSGEMYYVELTGPERAGETTAKATAQRFRESRTALSNAMRADLGLQATAELTERQSGAEVAERPARKWHLPWRRQA